MFSWFRFGVLIILEILWCRFLVVVVLLGVEVKEVVMNVVSKRVEKIMWKVFIIKLILGIIIGIKN